MYVLLLVDFVNRLDDWWTRYKSYVFGNVYGALTITQDGIHSTEYYTCESENKIFVICSNCQNRLSVCHGKAITKKSKVSK